MSENNTKDQVHTVQVAKTPIAFDDIPRIVTENPDGTKTSTVDWASVGLESLTINPENGEPWKLHRGDIAVNGCVFLWVRDVEKVYAAGLGEAVMASLNGTSWKVSQDDVNRAYDKECAEKGQRGQKVRLTLEHRLWNRLAGIRRKAEFRNVTVKTVTVTVTRLMLPNGAIFEPSATDVEGMVAELRSAWIDAMMALGVPPQSVVGMAEGQDFEKMLAEASKTEK